MSEIEKSNSICNTFLYANLFVTKSFQVFIVKFYGKKVNSIRVKQWMSIDVIY